MKIKVSVGTDKTGSDCQEEVEINDADLESMSDEEKAKYIEEVVRDVAFQYISWSYEVIDE